MQSPQQVAVSTAVAVLTDDQVVAAVDQREAIEALRDVFVSAQRGAARAIPKTMVRYDETSTAHSLGAVDSTRQIVAFKSWVNTPAGASALLSLFSAASGRTLAVMNAGALGMLRTAGTAALATGILADPAAAELAILGTGRQALHQVAAIHSVRPLELVRVWSPSEHSRVEFANLVHFKLGIPTAAVDSARSAVADAPIVTTVTRARDPFLEGDWLAHGAHVNAVGAILPGAAELMPSVLALSDLTTVDDLDNAARGSRELKEHFGDDLGAVKTLGEVIDLDVRRPTNPRLTVYKGLGSGLADLAVAVVAWSNVHHSPDTRNDR